MNQIVREVTERIIHRSREHRSRYLRNMTEAMVEGPFRHRLPSSNLAHSMAVCPKRDGERMRDRRSPHIAIITAYNDLLSAHHAYENFPAILKQAVAAAGGVAQVAAGVPAMCDGVTQGEPGMDLSLISRDVIAMATVIGLSHNVFDGALLLGICDKILPGLLMGALQYGHLPMILVPGGPMRSGLSNKEKAHARELFAEGKIGQEEMLAVECQSYHGTGTCTFYGTANSNQLIAELLGLHLPGASFVNPDDPLRDALTIAAATRVTGMTHLGSDYTPIGRIVCEQAVVNAIVGLLATGGSTNQTMHLVGWPGPPVSASTGMISPIFPGWYPCWRGSIPTGPGISIRFSTRAEWPRSLRNCWTAVCSTATCPPWRARVLKPTCASRRSTRAL